MKNGIQLNEADLEEVFSRSSGPGGQNVNKVSTRVTLRHRPTNVTVTVQDARSQATNRQLARERLIEALTQREAAVRAAATSEREKIRRQKSPRPKKVKRQFVQLKRHRAANRQQRQMRDE